MFVCFFRSWYSVHTLHVVMGTMVEPIAVISHRLKLVPPQVYWSKDARTCTLTLEPSLTWADVHSDTKEDS